MIMFNQYESEIEIGKELEKNWKLQKLEKNCSQILLIFQILAWSSYRKKCQRVSILQNI